MVQPGAKLDERTYCPVSGVVFQVKGSSSHRDIDGKPLYFCCEACAAYFSANREHVLAARSISAPP